MIAAEPEETTSRLCFVACPEGQRCPCREELAEIAARRTARASEETTTTQKGDRR